jgi:hypothetical protein
VFVQPQPQIAVQPQIAPATQQVSFKDLIWFFP